MTQTLTHRVAREMLQADGDVRGYLALVDQDLEHAVEQLQLVMSGYGPASSAACDVAQLLSVARSLLDQTIGR